MPPQITIIGLGLIGASAGLALKAQEKEFVIVGHDRENEAVTRARKLGAIDKSHWNLINACEQADFILLALPTAAILPTLTALRGALKPGCVLLDAAPIKGPLLAAAADALSENTYFVGGNPLLARSGLTAADASADLFKEASWALCPTPATAADAIRVATDFVSLLGAQPLFLDPAEHDGLMAAVQGLPSVLAAALTHTLGQAAAWRELRRMAGVQFEQTSYLPDHSAADLAAGILPSAPFVSGWIDLLIAELQEWQRLLAGQDEQAVQARFAAALETRQAWLHTRARGEWEATPGPPLEKPSVLGRLFGLSRR